MGIISNIAGRKSYVSDAVARGRSQWGQVFNATTKEDRFPPSRPVTPGGSFARSSTSEPAAFKRLLQAMRSMAPGGWSDDRWAQEQHFTGAPYVAIHRLCVQLQQAEFQVFRKDPRNPDGKVPVKPDDPCEGPEREKNHIRPYDLVRLLQRPNNQDSFGKWMYRLGQQKFLTGTGLNWLVPNQFGVPYEMYVIPTGIAIPQPAINPDYPDGYWRIQPLYPYGPFSSYPTPASAVGAPIPAQWMMRFLFPHPILRYDGYSPMSGLRQHIDAFEMMDRSRTSSMRRQFIPSLIMDMSNVEGTEPWVEAELERIRADIENVHSGPDNAGSIFVPPPGANLTEMGRSAKEMEYYQSWSQMLDFILGGGFGITKPAAGMVEDAAYSTLFATMKQLHLITLSPECEDIGNEITHHLASHYGDDLVVEIRCRRIDDHDLLMAKLNMAMQAVAITKNQLLKALELPTTDQPWGDEMAGTPPAPPPGQEMIQDPNQQQQAEQPQEEDEEQQYEEAGPTPPQVESGQQVPVEARAEPPEVTRSRPSPGNLSVGALGPRKVLGTYRTKAAYEAAMAARWKNHYSGGDRVHRNGKR